MQTDDGAGLEDPDLDEVAQLVGQPDAALAFGVLAAAARRPTERFGQRTGVGELADQTSRVVPDPHHAAAATVAQAVGGDLARCHEEVEAADGIHVAGQHVGRDIVAHCSDVVEAEGESSRCVAGGADSGSDRCADAISAPITCGLSCCWPVDPDERMAATCLIDDIGGQTRWCRTGTSAATAHRPSNATLSSASWRWHSIDLNLGTPGPDRLPDPAPRTP